MSFALQRWLCVTPRIYGIHDKSRDRECPVEHGGGECLPCSYIGRETIYHCPRIIRSKYYYKTLCCLRSQNTVLGHHQPASETAFEWSFAGWLMVAHFMMFTWLALQVTRISSFHAGFHLRTFSNIKRIKKNISVWQLGSRSGPRVFRVILQMVLVCCITRSNQLDFWKFLKTLKIF